MPEKCLFCGEQAVIEEAVDGGKDQLICVECGSLAAVATLKDYNSFDSDPDDNRASDGNAVNVDSNTICESCGITLDDSDAQDLCTDCLQENANETNQSSDSLPHPRCDNEIDSIRTELPPQDHKCISCNSKNVFLDSINGDERLICSDCGSINSGVVLTNDEFCSLTRSKSNNFTTLPRFAVKNKIQEGLKEGLNKVNLLCLRYCFSADIKLEAEDMFRKIFHHPKFIHTQIETKQNVAAACLFLVCRLHNFPISLTHFRKDVSIFKTFLKATRHITDVLDIKLPHMSIVNQLTIFLGNFGFGSEIVETVKVKDILFLYRKAWLTQGRSRMGLITIAIYYAYLSSKKCPRFISLKNFCSLFRIPYLSQSLAKECKVLLLKLAQHLPWVREGTVHVKKLHLHINDILEYQESLFHLAFKSEEDDDDDHDDADKSDQQAQALSRSLNSVRKRKEPLLPSAAKKKKLIKDEPTLPETLLPLGIDLDSTELQETEFEEEINSYILSPEEQAHMRKHKINIWEK